MRTKEEISSIVNKAMKRVQKVFCDVDLNTLGNLPAKKIGKVTPLFRLLRSVQNAGFA